MLIAARWPDLPESLVDADAEAEIGWVIDLVSEVRSVRSELNVPPAAQTPLYLDLPLNEHRWLEANYLAIQRLANISLIEDAPVAKQARLVGAVPFVLGEMSGAVMLANFIDVDAERARLEKELAKLETEIQRAASKLANNEYVSRAPDHVVEETREKLAEAEAARDKLGAALKRLEAVA
jgi:valyl-tRNA synthetase